MKHLYKIVIFFLFPLATFAQSNYHAGYVVNIKGDTIRGFIDYQSWDSNPKVISFKSAISDPKPAKFTVDDIVSFSVDHFSSYQRCSCSITMDETNTTRLGTGRDTSYRTDIVFLKILQKGRNAALYEYADNLKKRFYVAEAPAYMPTELIYRTYYDYAAIADNHGRNVIENTYLKQLFALANKYNVLDDRLSKTFETAGYNKDDLTEIVSKINNISKAEYESKHEPHAQVNLYLSGALNISGTTSPSSSSYSTAGGPSYTSYLPAIAIGVNVIPDPVAGRVELRGELALADAQLDARYKLNVSPYTSAKASYNRLDISFVPQIIYNIYNAPNFKFYVGAGVAITYSNYSNTFFGDPNPGDPVTNFPGDQYYFNKVNDNFLLKAGFKIDNKWEVFFNYFTPVADTQGGYFGFDDNNKQVGVTYFFGK